MDDQADKQPLGADGALPARMLACIRCQRSKVRCDRTMPCSNCVRRGIQCIPGSAVAPRQRRKRFPERELLDRLRAYEALLKQNSIDFEPLHKDSPSEPASKIAYRDSKSPTSDDDESDAEGYLVGSKLERTYWDVLASKHAVHETDDTLEDNLRSDMSDMWANAHQNFGFLLPFGQPKVKIDLSDRHPDQPTIFKLWHIYLANVDPLLKVTHTPSLQAHIVTAAANVAAASPALTALMFAIYCMAVLSLREVDCQQQLGQTRSILLTDFQLSCQQALANCGVLKTTDRESLTALYLYIISIEPSIDPYSISSLLGIVMRIATRMGIQSESSYKQLAPLEAELRRRLWWSIIVFDARIADMAGRSSLLLPTWDCAMPCNLSDFELQADMKEYPKPQSIVSEAVFVVSRAELSNCVRHATFYLDLINPSYKLMAQRNPKFAGPQDDILEELEERLEKTYFQHFSTENSVQVMTNWFTKQMLDKTRLLQHYSRVMKSPASITIEQFDASLSASIAMLNCDTTLINTPSVKGFHWYLYLYFPFIAYFHMFQHLRKRPGASVCEQAWVALSANYEARVMFRNDAYDQLFPIFAKLTLTAWKACEENWKAAGIEHSTNAMVEHVKMKLNAMQSGQSLQAATMQMRLDEVWQPLAAQDPRPSYAVSDDFDLDMSTFAANFDSGGSSYLGMLMEDIDLSMMPNMFSQAQTSF